MTQAAVSVAAAPYVTIPIAAVMTGYTEKAIRRKIDDGVWLMGREYIKAPDGHILISIKGYTLWAERGWALKSANDPSALPSPSTAGSNAARSS